MISCTNSPNALTRTFSKRWSFIWRCFFPVSIPKVGLSCCFKFLSNLTFPKTGSKKQLIFTCFKININAFQKCKFVFLKNTLIWTRLWRFVSMIICSILTQKWYFCQWFNNIFEVVRIFWLRGHSKTASFAKLVFFDPFPQCHTLPFFSPPYTIFSLCHWLKSDNLRHETEETFFLYTQPAFKFTQKPSFWFFYC